VKTGTVYFWQKANICNATFWDLKTNSGGW